MCENLKKLNEAVPRANSLALGKVVLKMELTSETLSYASSVDGTQPLLADVVFAANGRLKPLLLVIAWLSREPRRCGARPKGTFRPWSHRAGP